MQKKKAFVRQEGNYVADFHFLLSRKRGERNRASLGSAQSFGVTGKNVEINLTPTNQTRSLKQKGVESGRAS